MVSKVANFQISLGSFHCWHSVSTTDNISWHGSAKSQFVKHLCNYSTKANKKDLWSDLINPKFSNNDVMDCGGDFSPGVMITRFVKLEVRQTVWDNLEILATKFTSASEFLPEDPVLMLNMKGWRRGMVAHLQVIGIIVASNTISATTWNIPPTRLRAIMVSITKFFIVIGSLSHYLSCNRRAITWVSNYRSPTKKVVNGFL